MKILRLFSVMAFVMAMVSCSTVKVVVDMDKTADFSKYETYSFLGWQYDSDKILNDFDRKRMRDAFISEFERRGLKPVKENGDMEVSLFIVVDQKTSVTAYTNYYGGRYGGYNRYMGGWGYGYANTTYTESDYLEGTLIMDVFDGETKNQVWQAIATGTVTENPAKREKTIPASVQALMRKFPVHPK
ncbi:MAG: DUF4136 domain-containing protein [Bacteroidales bacterium]|nr:DUF4136 domain-containing protein [Bacteroidales bacterium]